MSFTELRDDFIAIRPKSSLSVDCRLLKVCPDHWESHVGRRKCRKKAKFVRKQNLFAANFIGLAS